MEHPPQPAIKMWPARLRWRMRGAWLWPTFLVLTVADGLLIELLPMAGDGPAGIVPALILAGFLNLFAVLAAFLFVPLLRRRRRDLPRPIAHNYLATGGVLLMFTVVLGAGLVHRPARIGEHEDRQAATRAFHDAVLSRDDLAEYRENLSFIDSRLIEEDLYRVCAPGPDPKRFFCMFVNTDQSPPGLEADTTRESNASFSRPGTYK